MKIYLVNPSRFLKDGTIEKAKRIFFPSLTLPLLAAMTPPPHNVTIVEELVDEIAAFPSGEHDDLVDSTTLALMRFRQGGFLRLPSDEPEEPRYFQRKSQFAYY